MEAGAGGAWHTPGHGLWLRVTMVHRNILVAMGCRRQSTIECVYVRPAPRGHAHVLIDDGVGHEIRAMRSSFELHAYHGRLLGQQHHQAQTAAFSAFRRGFIGAFQLAVANATRRRANCAKHSPHVTRHLRHGRVAHQDPLQDNDPWRLPRRSWADTTMEEDGPGEAISEGKTVCDVACARHEVGCQTEGENAQMFDIADT